MKTVKYSFKAFDIVALNVLVHYSDACELDERQ